MRSFIYIILFITGIFITEGNTQTKKTVKQADLKALPAFTPAAERLAGHERRKTLLDASLLRKIPAVNIGPTIMSGRVVDIDVNPDNPIEFYVAYASGGVFVTRNNGQSFEPIFDDQSTITIGDIAVDWKNGETIWVGTGESNSSRSSYAGTGIFKSTDKGKTWIHLGLEETHHIGKIIIHPNDPNTVWVAAMGHLYSYNSERGVFKTVDGGKSWTQTLFINPKTGAIEMEIHPQNPDILYCTMWQRERHAWNFVESGSGSGIYGSTDGGRNWEVLSRPGSGFPAGDHVGRIGLAIYPQNPDIIYAFLDNQSARPDLDIKDKALTKEQLKKMGREEFLKLEDQAITEYLKDQNFPERFTAESIRKMVDQGKIQPIALVHYVEDANKDLFDKPIIGAELYRSNDAGRTWQKTHTDYLEGLYYTYGYYFGKMSVSPVDPDRVYLYGVDIVKSHDGGKGFSSILRENVHVDFHGLWINPKNANHMIASTDGGLNMTYDEGAVWSKLNAPAVSQFYFINVDNARPYNVYGGMQDNGTWYGSSNFKADNAWHATGQNPYKELGGGDGMQVAIDTVNNYVYYGYQFGHYFRKNMTDDKVEYITPRHELGERPLRWNWQTPVIISRHNPSIVYMGSNHFHRSLDFAQSFSLKSKDLTNGGKFGDVPYGTLTSIDESPLRFGLLYTGSDDGLVHVSRDAGQSWERISDQLPQHFWVSRVAASHHAEGRVYVSLNGYRYDHFKPYVFLSEDYGKTWINISGNLPAEPVNVVLEDPTNDQILYVGTDNGLYISLDRGKSYMIFSEALPHVAVHDLKIQIREKDLLVGTHGRSIYKIDLTHVQALNDSLMGNELYVLNPKNTRYNPNWGRLRQPWSEAQEPAVSIPCWSSKSTIASVDIYAAELKLNTLPALELSRGLQYISYDLSIDTSVMIAYTDWLKAENPKEAAEIEIKKADNGKLYLRPGKYTIKISNSEGQISTAVLHVEKGRMGFRWGVRPSEREERKIKEFHWEE
jgi:photosystem II stability/assembly factor-like uncharacterized protein